MLSGNVIATSGFAIANSFTDYDVKTGNFNEWLVQRVKMGIVKVTWGSGDTVMSNDGMNISGYIEKAMNFTTVQLGSVFDTNAVLDGYQVKYDKALYKLNFYGANSGTVQANTALTAVASGQLSLASAVVYLQVFGT
jgi:hypothetical protein